MAHVRNSLNLLCKSRFQF